MEYLQLTTIRDSLNLILNYLKPVKVDTVPISSAGGRVCFRDYFTPDDIPAFTRSTMDGYAVRAKDTRGASAQSPVLLNLIGSININEAPTIKCHSGETCYVPTGGMLPEGADAVVMVEKTEVSGQFLEVQETIASGENSILKGEDYKKGELIIARGTLIRPQEAGLLAFTGVGEVEVYNKVKIAIFGSGDEVVPLDVHPQPPKIRDLNSYTLSSLFEINGFLPMIRGILPDREEEVENRLKEDLLNFDAIVVSGGTSKGTRDVMSTVLTRMGNPGIIAHGLTIKPGKPTLLGVTNHIPIIVLPGHPASCFITATFIALPILRFLGGRQDEPLKLTARGFLKKRIISRLGLEEYIRVNLFLEKGRVVVEPIPGESGLISTLVKANGLVKVPENMENLEEGVEVEVLLL